MTKKKKDNLIQDVPEDFEAESMDPEDDIGWGAEYIAEEKEVEEGDEPEETKEDPAAMTGGMGVAASSPGYAAGGVISSTGTHGLKISGSGTWSSPTVFTGGTITTGTISSGSFTTPVPAPKNVDSPPRFTKKILVAFVDENEEDDEKNIVWAKNLKLQHGKITFDEFGNAVLHLELDLKDVYGNEED